MSMKLIGVWAPLEAGTDGTSGTAVGGGISGVGSIVVGNLVGRYVGGVKTVGAAVGNNVGDVVGTQVGGTVGWGQVNAADEQTENCGHVSWHVVNRASFVAHGTGSEVWRPPTTTPSSHNFVNDTEDRSSVHPTAVTHPQTPPWQS